MEPNPEPPKQKISKQLLLGILLVTLVLLIAPRVYKTNKSQKPQDWIISQSLFSTLSKQQMLSKSAGGQVNLGSLAKAATSSAKLKPEIVRIGQDYLLSTGANGQVSAEIPAGNYKLGLAPIQEVDFTGVPVKLKIKGGLNIAIGLKSGSGKIKSKNEVTGESISNKVTISLFNDKNGDGIQQKNEPNLPWAGVTVKFSRI